MKAAPAKGRASVEALSPDHVGEIGRVLHEWSPNENWPVPGGTASVYGSYALLVYGLLRDGQEIDRIASLLAQIRIEDIGVPPNPESDRQTAQRLIAWWNSL